MKNSFLTVVLLCTFGNSYSQIKYVKPLILSTDSEATKYLDSLNTLKRDRYYNVRKDTSDDGNLFLSVSFLPKDEKFYTCTAIQLGFTKTNGVNYCTFQIIMGTLKYSGPNLTYIKKNFKNASKGHWTKVYKRNIPIIIVATFDQEYKTDGVYSIIYQAKSTNKLPKKR